jgi:alpha-maltose-1-phosphate synthase
MKRCNENLDYEMANGCLCTKKLNDSSFQAICTRVKFTIEAATDDGAIWIILNDDPTLVMKVWLPAIHGGSGADVFTLRLAEALRRKGLDAEISWFPNFYELFPFLLRRVPPPRGTTIIHANSWNAFAFKRKSIPLIATEQLGVFDPAAQAHKGLAQSIYHQALIRQFVKASFRLASAVTAVSDYTALGLQRSLGIEPTKVIYNSVNTDMFAPGSEKEGIRSGPFRLLFVGNPIRRKGADLFAPIMRALGAEFELYFTAGRRKLTPQDVASNMFPVGRVTNDLDLVKLYQRSDALLFPSRFEGLPIAVLEAMACAKPVIAANTSSLAEVIEDGVSGILCPTDEIDAFVDTCRKLANEPQTCKRFGSAARDRVGSRFSENIVVPQYINLYKRILSS